MKSSVGWATFSNSRGTKELVLKQCEGMQQHEARA